MRRTKPAAIARYLAIGSVVSAAALLAQPADAQSFSERLMFNVEGGVGLGAPDYNLLGSTDSVFGIEYMGRVGIMTFRGLYVNVVGGGWTFPGGPSPGTDGFLGGGFRLDSLIGRWVRPAFNLDVGAAFTPRGTQFFFTLGGAIEIQLTRAIGLGPMVRFIHLAAGNTMASDRSGWSAGLSLTFRIPEPEAAPPPPDTDRDGVPDADDQCRTEPAGTTPDPNRRGCPMRDSDGDTVMDNDDLCPNAAQGEHPDPNRRGCPIGDSDGDGVLDNEDQCATVAAGEHPDPDRRGCPDADDDNDGVLNHADQCRAEPAGPRPDPARAGCPIADRDNDSVPDATDHCPDQPGAPNPDPNRNGCPGLVQVSGGQIRISQQIFFATNSDRILPRSFPVLQAVADVLRAMPQVRRVAVNGHTDDVGPDPRNLTLSQRRAESVVAWLGQHDVAADRLEAHGYGETRPTVPITPALRGAPLNAARSQNRRVEFVIIDPAPASAATPGN